MPDLTLVEPVEGIELLHRQMENKPVVQTGAERRPFVPTPKDFRPFFSGAMTRQERMADLGLFD